jgi:Flp pilus assembly protein TadB
MDSQILLISLLVSATVALASQRFLIVLDRNAATRLSKSDQPAQVRDVFETVGSPFSNLIPNYFKQLESNLYWAAFVSKAWVGKTPAWVIGRQLLMAAGLGGAAFWLLRQPLALVAGAFAGWMLMAADLGSTADGVRKRIAQEMPEFLQLMAAESASGAGLDTVIARSAEGEGYVAAWLRRVLSIAHGRSLFPTGESGEEGVLFQEARRSGHSYLISFAVQLGFAVQGTQVREALVTLAKQFADTYIGHAEMRAEQLAEKLGLMVSIFYFLPFLVVILVIVGLPIMQAF